MGRPYRQREGNRDQPWALGDTELAHTAWERCQPLRRPHVWGTAGVHVAPVHILTLGAADGHVTAIWACHAEVLLEGRGSLLEEWGLLWGLPWRLASELQGQGGCGMSQAAGAG